MNALKCAFTPLVLNSLNSGNQMTIRTTLLDCSQLCAPEALQRTASRVPGPHLTPETIIANY